MGTIKLKRGSGSPAGSIEANEVAMDVAAKNLYTSTDGSDAVVLADNTVNTLNNISATLDISDKVAIEGTAGGLNYGTGVIGASIVNLKTDNTGFDKGQLTLEDSNSKVMKLVGQHDTGPEIYKYIILMDPDGEENMSGAFTGDYGFYYNKRYQGGTVRMENNVFGARDGFEMTIHDDYNGGSPNPGPFPGFGGYGYKPMRINAESFEVLAEDSDSSVDSVLLVDDSAIECKRPVQFPNYTTTERNALTNVAFGMQIYNTTDNKMQAYVNVSGTTPSWVDLH